jgi:hypothetical protein
VGDSAYAGTQVVAVAIAVGLAIVAGLATKLRLSGQGRGGLLMGWDRRASTSKTIAVIWTVLIAYMLLTLIFVADSHTSTALRDTLNKAPDLYFVFLGGPYAAAVLAKIGVTRNTQTGTLQKSDGSGVFNPLDVIADDQGATDLYDFQYTIFNLVAMIAVVIAFASHPGRGFPQLPDFLAVLTGGSAFVYTANKVTGRNPPSVASVSPDSARVRDWVTIDGANLFEKDASSGSTIIKVGGALVPPGDIECFPDHLNFRIPPVGAGAQAISLVTNSGTPMPAGTSMSVKVVADAAQLNSFSTTQVKAGAALTLFGDHFYPASSLESSGRVDDPVGATSVSLQLAAPPAPAPQPAPVVCPIDPAHLQTDEALTVTVPANAVGGAAPVNVTDVIVRGTSIRLSSGLPLQVIP